MKTKAETERKWEAEADKRKNETKAERDARETREVESFMSMARAIVQTRKDSR